jgi:hypothetical protein
MNPEHQLNSEESIASLIAQIPPQYKGMKAEALQEIWADPNNIPVKVEEIPGERAKEIQRRKSIVEELKRIEGKYGSSL